MPSFIYQARDQQGSLQTGHLDAVGEEEVVAILQNRGLVVTSLHQKEAGGGRKRKRGMARKLRSSVKTYDKVQFCTQLSTLLEAGIPLVKCLDVIVNQCESRPLLLAVENMRADIEGGQTFRDAMAKHPKIFSEFWVNLIETGEASGHLAQSLNQLSSYLESSQTLQQKATTAMTYPLVLIGASGLAVGIFVIKIIPIFSGIFDSMGMELPMLTRAIMDFSAFAQKYFLVLAAAGAGGFLLSRQFLRTERGAWLRDSLLIKLPVFNKLFIGLQLAQFARGLATLLESGVPILYSLEIAKSSASNKLYQRAIGEVRDFVREGKTMAEPLEESGLFPPMMVQMVGVGEEIGELGKMLDKVATYYEEQVSIFIERMSVLFEPLAIMFMSVVIGTLVVAMFMPIFNMAGQMGPGGG